MFNIESYKSLEIATNNCEILRKQTYVRFVSKPLRLDILDNGCTILHNGAAQYYDSVMGRWLAKQKMSGLLFISAEGPAKLANRWVDRFVNEPIDKWNGAYHFYHIGDQKNSGEHHSALPLITENLERNEVNRKYSDMYGDTWDGFLVVAETKRGQTRYFRKLPSRTIPGKIRAFVKGDNGAAKGAIVHVNHNGKMYAIKTTSVPGWLRDLGPAHTDYVGKDCLVNYTQFTPGDRVSNFSSPRLVSVR